MWLTARIGEQALDLRLPQRHQVADQHVERAEGQQQRAPASRSAGARQPSARSIATSPASITTPDSIALMPLGACEWASGSQVCSGTSAAFTPKPIRNSAPAASSGSGSGPRRRRRHLLQVQRAGLREHQRDADQHEAPSPTADCTRYFTPASSAPRCSR